MASERQGVMGVRDTDPARASLPPIKAPAVTPPGSVPGSAQLRATESALSVEPLSLRSSMGAAEPGAKPPARFERGFTVVRTTDEPAEHGSADGKALSEMDRKRAALMLKRSKVISELANVDLAEVAKLLRAIDFDSGTVVVREGDWGNCCYIVDVGELDVFLGAGAGATKNPTGKISPGELFGELGALYECRRTATVVARTKVRAWKLRHADLTRVIRADAVLNRRAIFEMLREAPSFQSLDEKAVSKIADACEHANFPSGANIVAEGQEGDAMYIVKAGTVLVTQDKGKEQKPGVVSGAPVSRASKRSVLCRVIGAGGYFGERALITNEPRTATVQAASDVECLVIKRDRFQQMLGPYHRFFKEQMHAIVEADAAAEAAEAGGGRGSGGEAGLSRAAALAALAPPYKELKVLKPLGVGTFAAVALVEHARTQRLYALKMVSRVAVKKGVDEQRLLNEREAMLAAQPHPCVLGLHGTYQDPHTYYLLLEPCIGGELYSLIREAGALQPPHARFYAAAAALALQRVHQCSHVFRDLKPENLMLDAQGYPRLCDFGLAKRLDGEARAYSSVGTLEYMAPEVLRRTGHTTAADWWSFGVLIFEMLVGRTPFVAKPAQRTESEADAMALMTDILAGNVRWPERHEPQLDGSARDLVSRLLRPDVTERLGHGGAGVADIIEHPWFAGFDFRSIPMRTSVPPYRPELSGPTDTSWFSVDVADFARKIKTDKGSPEGRARRSSTLNSSQIRPW